MIRFIIKCMVILSLGHNLVKSECPSKNFFDCKNNICIALFWRCDGEDDCGNWEDEHDCHDYSSDSPLTNISCPEKHVHCKGQRDICIPDKWVCDGMKDCDNGSDEADCSSSNSDCKEFQCNNYQCIPSRWRCDGHPDCSDHSDEHNCNSTELQNCDKKNGFYQCYTGECIPHEKVCDNKKDCPQGDDEGVECSDSGCHRRNCSHYCFVSPHGPECYCPDGYHIDSDNITCVDIDECVSLKSEGICSQVCVNTEGSYTCECHDDYQLVNNRSCVAKYDETLLLFSNSEGIRGLYLTNKLFFPVYQSLKQTVGIDVYGADDRVFWVDLDDSNSGVYSVDLSGHNFQPIITSGLKGPEDIAIDWIGENIYITESALNKIIVCKLDGSICSSMIFDGIDRPRSIVVDPPNGFVYWTEWGSNAGIYRAGMDGSNKVALVNKLIEWPNGLTHDTTTHRLYWTEAKLGAIEYYDLVTKERNVLIEDAVFHPFSISVFEDNLYWSDWIKYSLETCDKFTGHNQSTLLKEIGQNIMGVHAYHPLMQKRSHNPCWNHFCSHLCLIAPNRMYSCSCPDHMYLDTDHATCIAKRDYPFLLVSADNQVRKFYSESIGKDAFVDLKMPSHVKVSDLTYNWNTQTLYIFDMSKLEIGSIDLKRSLPYFEPIIHEQLDKVEGLTYDAHTNNLYWLEVKAGLVEVSTLNGSARVVLMKDLERPVDIVLYPEYSRMYIAVLGSEAHVMVSDMDGQNQQKLFASSVGIPISLALDKIHEKLYWANAKEENIEWADLKTFKGHSHHRGVARRHLGYVMSIAISNDSLYWTNMESDYLYHELHLHKTSQLIKTPINVHNQKPSVKKILLAYKEEEPIGPCVKSNGGCSHLCLLGRFGSSCHCPLGYHLAQNLKTCVKDNDETTSENVLFLNVISHGENIHDFGLIPYDFGDEDLDLHDFHGQFIDEYESTEKAKTLNIHSQITTSANIINNDEKIKLIETNHKDMRVENKVQTDNTNKAKIGLISSNVKVDKNSVWPKILIGSAAICAVALIVIFLYKKNYRKVGSVLYKKGDRLKGIIIQNPIYKTDIKGTDQEPLNDSNDDMFLSNDELVDS